MAGASLFSSRWRKRVQDRAGARAVTVAGAAQIDQLPLQRTQRAQPQPDDRDVFVEQFVYLGAALIRPRRVAQLLPHLGQRDVQLAQMAHEAKLREVLVAAVAGGQNPGP